MWSCSPARASRDSSWFADRWPPEAHKAVKGAISSAPLWEMNVNMLFLLPRTELLQHHYHHHTCGFSDIPCSFLPSTSTIIPTHPWPSTSCSVVFLLSSHHVCGVGASSLPQGWEWGARRRTWQTPGEWRGGRVEPWHRAELPGGLGHLPSLWPQEDYPLWWGQDVRYAQTFSSLIVTLSLFKGHGECKAWRFRPNTL